MAAAAGLGVLLEKNGSCSATAAAPGMVLSKGGIVLRASAYPSAAAFAAPAAAAAPVVSSFLQKCLLCHKELPHGKDIFMYRGDKAFCSEECRHRQILIDEFGSAKAAKQRPFLLGDDAEIEL